MTNPEFFTVTKMNGDEVEWVKITTGENAYLWMTKSDWEAQEAQAELGGTL